MTGCSLTVLHAGSSFRATKQHHWRAGTGWTTLDYAAGKLFRFTEHRISSIRDLGTLVDRLRGDPTAMVVRGTPSNTARNELAKNPAVWMARKLSGPSTPGTLDDVPRRWLMTDIDKFACDPLELIDDPEAVVRRAISTMLPAEFQDVTVFYQFSSSAGFRNGIAGIHLWWWLDRPFDSPSMKRWLVAQTKATQCGPCKVDCSILSGNIPHYVADPIITGGHDPLPRRTGFIEGDEEAVCLRHVNVAPQRRPINVQWTGPAQLRRQYDKLKDALEFVPNDDVDREDWIRIGHAIKAQLGEAGKDLWLEWSASSAKAGKSGRSDTAEKKWNGFNPSRITGGTIFYLARQAGWSWDDDAIPADHGLPAYYPASTEPRGAALQRQNEAITSTIRDGASRAVLRQAIAAKRSQAIADCDNWSELSPGRKGAITRKAAREVLREAGMKRLPSRRCVLVTGAQGTGKTATAAEALVAIRGDVVVRNLQPSLDKAFEFAAAYSAQAGPDSLPVLVVRGRGAKANGDELMCPRQKVVVAAIDKGINVRKVICGKCALRPIPLLQKGCGYLQQEARIDAMGERGLFVGSHAYLHLPMPGPKPDIVVIDEGVVIAAHDVLEISPGVLRNPVPFRGSRLSEIIDGNATLERMAAALEDPAPLALLRAAGLTAGELRKARALVANERVEPDAGIDGSMTDAEIMKALERVPADDLGRVLITLGAVLREIDAPRDTMTGVVFHPTRLVNVSGRTERIPRIRVHRLKPLLGITAQTTLLLMDGTGSHPLNEAVFGTLEHVHTPVERDAYVIGTRGKTYSRQSITGCDRNREPIPDRTPAAGRLRRELAVVAGRLPGQVMVASTKPAVEALKADNALPANVAGLAHFGKVRGLNTWENCDGGLIAGVQSVSVEAVEDVARAFYATDPQPFLSSAAPPPDDWPKIGWPYVATRGRRMRDGAVVPIEVEVHPDPRAQEVLEQIREAEVIQTADRLRPVFNRRHLVLANNLVLPFTYDRTMTHAELVAGGTRLEQAYRATGLLPLGAADLHKAHKELFSSVALAKDGLRESGISGGVFQIEFYLGFPPTYFYRRQGQRGSPSRILVDPKRHPDSREAVEAVLGPLVMFERVDQPTPPADRADPPPVQQPSPPPASTRSDYADACTNTPSPAPPMPADTGAPSMDPPNPMTNAANEESEQAGLDSGLIYRGPVAWQPPVGLYRTATGRLIAETELKPPLEPWLLRPIAAAPAWYDELKSDGSDDCVVWWGPMCPVLPEGLDGLAFRSEPDPGTAPHRSS